MSFVRQVILVGLLAVVLSSIAAGSASASLRTGSATGPFVAAGTTLSWTNLAAVKIRSSFFGTDINCSTSTFKFSSSNYTATPVAGKTTQLSFTVCTAVCSGATTIANVTVNNAAMTGDTALFTTTSPNGSWNFKTGGNVIAVAACGLSCNYGAPTAGFTGTFTGGNPADITYGGVQLASDCFDTATLTATYQSPGPANNGLFTT